MNSKTKGNIGESIILTEFVKRGILVSIPFGDNARYDLIAEFNGRLNKIQVKYCARITENNSVSCPTASSKNHTTNKTLDTYVNDVDYIAFYILPWDISCIMPIEKCTGTSICLRKDFPKNGQKVGINLVQDYSFDKILCVETLHGTSEPEKEDEDKVQTTTE